MGERDVKIIWRWKHYISSMWCVYSSRILHFVYPADDGDADAAAAPAVGSVL